MISHHVATVLRSLAFFSLFGLTTLLAALQDVLAIGTAHITVCEKATSLIVRWQLSSLGGLWNLFRGR